MTLAGCRAGPLGWQPSLVVACTRPPIESPAQWMQSCKQKCNGICTRPLIQAAGSKGRTAAAVADTPALPSCCCAGPVKESGSRAVSRSVQTQQYDDGDASYVHEYDSYGAEAQQEGGLLGAKVWGELFFNTQTQAAGAHSSSVMGKAVWSM